MGTQLSLLSIVLALVLAALSMLPQPPTWIRESLAALAALSVLYFFGSAMDEIFQKCRQRRGPRQPTSKLIERHEKLIKWLVLMIVFAGMLVAAPHVHRLYVPPAPAQLKIYYSDSALDEKTIIAATGLPPTSCTAIQVDPIRPENFELCGIWAVNSGDVATTQHVWIYLNFSAEIADAAGNLGWRRSTNPDKGYPVEFRYYVGPLSISPGQRWDLPWFYGTPVPAGKMSVRLRVFYGQKEPAEAKFTFRPPK